MQYIIKCRNAFNLCMVICCFIGCVYSVHTYESKSQKNEKNTIFKKNINKSIAN